MVFSPLKRHGVECAVRATLLSVVLTAVASAQAQDIRIGGAIIAGDAGVAAVKGEISATRSSPATFFNRPPLGIGTNVAVALVADLGGATADVGGTPAIGSSTEPAPRPSRPVAPGPTVAPAPGPPPAPAPESSTAALAPAIAQSTVSAAIASLTAVERRQLRRACTDVLSEPRSAPDDVALCEMVLQP